MRKITRLLYRLIGHVPNTETGEENAQRFVAVVLRLVAEQRHVVLSSEPRRLSEMGGWTWMYNRRWRARVLELLRDAPLRDAKFVEPDNFDLWTFSTISQAKAPRIETLDLTDRHSS